MARLKRLVLERLMRYYRFLVRWTRQNPALTSITSAQIAEAVDVDPTQVRKDLGAIGILGLGRVGFDVCEVCRGIRAVLGFDVTTEAVLIGSGHLGSALLAYSNFAQYGLHIVAAFDLDARRVGRRIAGCAVRPTKELKPFVRRRGIRLGLITTPAEAAQSVADRLVDVGIKAIWNFAPTHLYVPRGVLLRNEHISLGLAEITYHLKSKT